jgi:TPR repeat protein
MLAESGKVKRDPAALYRKACDGKELSGCLRLGRRLFKEPSTRAKGRTWLELACEGGQPESCFEMAGILKGEKAPADKVRPYLLRACTGGVKKACQDL